MPKTKPAFEDFDDTELLVPEMAKEATEAIGLAYPSRCQQNTHPLFPETPTVM
jgi:hypothetical protein